MDTITNNAGSARTYNWLEKIRNAENTSATRGYEKAGGDDPQAKAANHREYVRLIKENAPSKEGRTHMKPLAPPKQVGVLGSGCWSAIA